MAQPLSGCKDKGPLIVIVAVEILREATPTWQGFFFEMIHTIKNVEKLSTKVGQKTA